MFAFTHVENAFLGAAIAFCQALLTHLERAYVTRVSNCHFAINVSTLFTKACYEKLYARVFPFIKRLQLTASRPFDFLVCV